MHVVHVTPRFLPAIGGCELYVYNLSRVLSARGHMNTVITTKSLSFNHPLRIDFRPPFLFSERGALPPDSESYDNINIHRVPAYLNMPGIILHSGLRSVLEKISGDVYTLHEVLSNVTIDSARYLLKMNKKPIVIIAHDITYSESISPIYGVMWRGFLKFLSPILCSVDAIVTQNRYDRELMEKVCKEKGKRIVLIHNGVDIDYYDPRKVRYEEVITFKKKYGLNSNTKIIIFVGRLEARKRIDLLIKMFYLVRRMYTGAVKLIIVGPDYGEESRLRNLAQSLGLEKDVIFTGKLSRKFLRVAYYVSDVFVTLSGQEAFGLTAAEAMSMGKPVVSHRWRGLDEVVIDGVNGIKVPPFDYREAAKVTLSILNDPSLHKRLSDNAYRIARSKFSLRIMATKIEKLYEALLS